MQKCKRVKIVQSPVCTSLGEFTCLCFLSIRQASFSAVYVYSIGFGFRYLSRLVLHF